MFNFLKFCAPALILVLTAPVVWCEEPMVPHPLTTYEGLSKVLAEKPKNLFLVDARTAAEYRTGRIPGAINIPVERLPNNPPTRDLSATIVLYCRFGNRSARAKDILESMGYKNVHVFGRLIQWKGPLAK